MLWTALPSSAVSFTGGRGRPTSKRRLDGGLSLTRDLDSALFLRLYAVDRVDDDTFELGAVAFDLLVRRGDDRVLLREVGEEFLVARLAACQRSWRRGGERRAASGAARGTTITTARGGERAARPRSLRRSPASSVDAGVI